MPETFLQRKEGRPLYEYAEEKLGISIGILLQSLTFSSADSVTLTKLLETGNSFLFLDQLRKRPSSGVANSLLIDDGGAKKCRSPLNMCLETLDSTTCHYVIDIIIKGSSHAKFVKACLREHWKGNSPIFNVIGTTAGRDFGLVERIALAAPFAIIQGNEGFDNMFGRTSITALEKAFGLKNRSSVDLKIYNMLKKKSDEHTAKSKDTNDEIISVSAAPTVDERLQVAEDAGEVVEINSSDESEEEQGRQSDLLQICFFKRVF